MVIIPNWLYYPLSKFAQVLIARSLVFLVRIISVQSANQVAKKKKNQLILGRMPLIIDKEIERMSILWYL